MGHDSRPPKHASASTSSYAPSHRIEGMHHPSSNTHNIHRQPSSSSQLKPTSYGMVDERDALYIFEGVRIGSLNKFDRALNEEECRQLIQPGAVFVFDEKPSFQSWQDFRLWSDVSHQSGFAYFYELVPQPSLNNQLGRTGFIKKCTSLFIPETRTMRHLISYYHDESLHMLPRPLFDQQMLLVPSYIGKMNTLMDARILIDAVDASILPKASRPPLPFECDTLIKPGAMFVWDDCVPGTRWWNDNLLWQPARIEGNIVVFQEMEAREVTPAPFNTSVGDETGLAVPNPTSSHPTQQQPVHLPKDANKHSVFVGSNPANATAPGNNTILIISPKQDGMIKKVTTLPSKTHKVMQVIGYSYETTLPMLYAPSLDPMLVSLVMAAKGCESDGSIIMHRSQSTYANCRAGVGMSHVGAEGVMGVPPQVPPMVSIPPPQPQPVAPHFINTMNGTSTGTVNPRHVNETVNPPRINGTPTINGNGLQGNDIHNRRNSHNPISTRGMSTNESTPQQTIKLAALLNPIHQQQEQQRPQYANVSTQKSVDTPRSDVTTSGSTIYTPTYDISPMHMNGGSHSRLDTPSATPSGASSPVKSDEEQDDVCDDEETETEAEQDCIALGHLRKASADGGKWVAAPVTTTVPRSA
ncbi:hypothetical protein SmJEL517_g04075 [Synchytrium microbalum]|uniref:Uncharacterized protein n=1 Tax=Synchytrium microbalum TaxID=1806994 RepID=A0A507C4F6_9FUNG|nr:uncharacterized protein SmJEL517_g04075 [Synchytrium microbalum]TPX32876.1 hypothetical protein SmJEL517_g04075 [Synchytrium microbalum]